MRPIPAFLLAAATVGSVTLAAPSRAHACSTCIPEGATEVVGGPTLPGNTGWLVWEVSDPLLHGEVFVDGVPASVELVPDVGPIGSLSATVARVTPTPTPGATVEVVDDGMHAWCFGMSDPSEPQSFVAAAPDTDAPVAIEDPYFDLHAYETATTTSCDFSYRGRLYLRGAIAAEPDQQAPRLIEIEVAHQDVPLLLRRQFLTDEPPTLLLDEADFAGVPLEELCMRVTLVDLAGNRGSASQWLCSPCHAVHERTSFVDEFPEEPRWTDDDLVRGGYCGIEAPPREPPADDSTGGDTGSDSTSGDPSPTTTTDDPGSDTIADPGQDDPDGVVGRGCSCRATASTTAGTDRDRWAGWLLLALLVVRRRRPAALR